MATPCPKPEKRQPKEKKPLKRTELKRSHKPIKKFSATRLREKPIYDRTRKKFLDHPDNQFCFIKGCGKTATTIEHIFGRRGNNYLDMSTWKPCCWEHNQELETNSELSAEYQMSKISGKKKLKKDL